jgi:SAM-dependent methyltransferase
MNLAGRLEWDEEISQYDAIGALCRRLICEELPSGWTFEGKRVLDFGCGAGRVLRHFAPEANAAEFIGCDVDEAAIEWASKHLTPPFSFLRNAGLPPLPEPDESFDLIYAISVFTHLTDSWAAWLLELRRLLEPEGLLVLSFIGEGVIEILTGEPYDDALIGKNDLHIGTPASAGGPTVLHSPWWLQSHLGRAFEIVNLRPYANREQRWGHGILSVRRLPGREIGIAELSRPDPDEPRELSSLRHNVRQLRRELRHLRRQVILMRGGWASHMPEGLLRLMLKLKPRREPRDLAGLQRELEELKWRVAESRREADRLSMRRVGDPGLEPGTSSLSEKRSNRLS